MIRNSRRVVALAFAGAVAIAPVLSGCGAGEEPQTAAPTQLTEGVNAWVPKTDAAKPQVSIRNMFLLGPRPGEALPDKSSVPLYATLINEVPGRADRLVSVTAPEFAGPARIAAQGVVLPAARERGEGTPVSLLGTAPAVRPAPAAGHETPSGAPSGSPSTKPSTAKTGKPGAKPSTGAPSAPASGEATAPASGAPTAPASGEANAPASGAPSAPASGEAAPAPGAKGPLVVLPQVGKELLGGETIQVTLQFEKAGAITVSVPVIPQQNEFGAYVPASQSTPFASAPGASPSGGGEATSPAGEPSTPASPGTEPSGAVSPSKSGEPEGAQTPAA
ncbi:hypothetical protein [Actinomadura oligospora]|uniref:hypothetical protein n=1 Tax=Actinomadura oligospora TaxID=111804 RepID=UPI0004BA4650|nr:hypothetical protein [Actinomadura oligospora]